MEDPRQQERAARRAASQQRKRQQALIAAGILVVGLAAAVSAARWWARQDVPAPLDQSTRLVSVLPLSALNNLGGDWVGVTKPEWQGMNDPARARSDCQAALALLGGEVRAEGTLTLLNPEGEPLAECSRSQ